ncbi:MAG: GNAT family N-acetyltransferase [Acidimicrobiia bacterium]
MTRAAPDVTSRPATAGDIPELRCLYRRLEAEMSGLHRMWPVADGLAEPIEDSFALAITDPNVEVLVGEIDGVPFGFLVARAEDLLPQANGERIGSIRLVFVEEEAREVGLGEVLRDAALEALGARGLTKFDAHVLPGHRLAKNFFESGGFSARSIVMFHDDGDG